WGPRAIGDHGAPLSLPKLKKAYEKVCPFFQGAVLPPLKNAALGNCPVCLMVNTPLVQGRTDNSWGPRAIGDHGARVLAQTQKSL
ncbi:unnamed protein product, partial [Staurois parvus]